jgi:hypothetical protein
MAIQQKRPRPAAAASVTRAYRGCCTTIKRLRVRADAKLVKGATKR